MLAKYFFKELTREPCLNGINTSSPSKKYIKKVTCYKNKASAFNIVLTLNIKYFANW